MTRNQAPAPQGRSGGERRLRRPERREQILAAATRAFSRAGYADTGLDAIAAEAGITRVLLYRHFDSKSDLYRAVLDRAFARLSDAVGSGGFGDDSIPALLHAAGEDPEGFRLLFRYAAKEAEFRDQMDRFSADAEAAAAHYLTAAIPDPAWAKWASQLVPTVAIEAVLCWLDAGRPDAETAARRIDQAIRGVIAAVIES
ncbi:hypothetical protein SUDANB15_06673 [Streptomyces sp. enrichment culture]|uniref:TetR/AcrR family transcriptional regulator n=1 Tax=Streptomyces sp. enrichment culture TaxID=1795815 RepID=UPI003F5707ED